MVVTRPIGTKMRRRAWISTSSPQGHDDVPDPADLVAVGVKDGQAREPGHEHAGAGAHRPLLSPSACARRTRGRGYRWNAGRPGYGTIRAQPLDTHQFRSSTKENP